MEAILYIILFYGGIALIGWIFSAISNAFKKHREKIRDQVATEVLSGLDIDNVITSYKQKLAHIKYSKTDSPSLKLAKIGFSIIWDPVEPDF